MRLNIMLEIGTVIDNRYEILKLIGQGGMSQVYLAMDKRNKKWAIKEIRKYRNDKLNDFVVQSAIAEANLLKKFDYSAIVRIVDIVNTDDAIYIIQDYIEGKTLSQILYEYGAQPQELVVEWGIKLCEALKYLHTREPAIIYRDMKPANIMLTSSGDIRIIDFGIAREYKQNNIADTAVLGTRGYAAPEQYGGKGQTDARTDIYGLGATLYHLVTGQNPGEPPYEIYPIRHWKPQLSVALEQIIEKCTQLNPDNRYQNCKELIYDLCHYEEYGKLFKWKSVFSTFKNVLNDKFTKHETKKYINVENFKDSINQINFDNAKYMAKVFSVIQDDERNCSAIKGPNYNEYTI